MAQMLQERTSDVEFDGSWMRLNEGLLVLFGCVAINPHIASSDGFFDEDYPAYIAAEAVYARQDINNWLWTNRLDSSELNQTLNRSIAEIRSKGPFEVVVGQISHYFEAYTRQPGVVNLPALQDGLDLRGVSIHYVNARPLSGLIELIEEKVTTLTTMSRHMAEAFYSVLHTNLIRGAMIPEFIEMVKCLELRLMLIEHAEQMVYGTGGYPYSTSDEALRLLVYRATGETQLVKSPEFLKRVAESGYTVPRLNSETLRLLAESFNRHRHLWMAFKRIETEEVSMHINETEHYAGTKEPFYMRSAGLTRKVIHPNRKVVNAIGRRAKKYHRAFQPPFFRVITSYRGDVEVVESKAKYALSVDLVRAYNALIEQMNPNIDAKLYQIRNGKMFTKLINENTAASKSHIEVYDFYKKYASAISSADVILRELRRRAKATEIKVYEPPEFSTVVPTSLKQFVGGLPFYTTYKVDLTAQASRYAGVMAGIYWREDMDLDLSATSAKRDVNWLGISRKGRLDYNNSIMHTGDIVAPGEKGAAEWIIFYAEADSAYLLTTSVYDKRDVGIDGNFRFILAGLPKDQPNTLKNYIAHPDDVFMEAVISLPDDKQVTLGVVPEAKGDGSIEFIIGNFRGATKRVARHSTIHDSVVKSIAERADFYLKVSDIYEIVETPLEADILLGDGYFPNEVHSLLTKMDEWVYS